MQKLYNLARALAPDPGRLPAVFLGNPSLIRHVRRPSSAHSGPDMRRLYHANGAISGRASDSRDQRNVLIFPASVGSAFTLWPRQIGGLVDWRHCEFHPAFTIGPTMRSRHSRNAVASPASASSTALRVGASPSPASKSRAARSTWSRQLRGPRDCPTDLGRTARAGPAHPVPPVLSGRDQASPTPSNRNLAPADGLSARECIMRLW